MPLIVVVAFLSLGAGECGAPTDDQTTGAAGTGGTQQPPPVCTCPGAPATVAHLPLQCLCTMTTAGRLTGAFLCSRTIADLTADARCNDGKPAYLNTGCGKLSLEPGGGFAGHVFTYNAAHDLIGVFQVADQPFGPCAAAGVVNYVYGEGLFPTGFPAAAAADTCATVTGCLLCGPSDVPGPRCQ